jgi:hypothetical protein
MNYKDYYSYIFEDCGCIHTEDCECGQQKEVYPWGTYDYTKRDAETQPNGGSEPKQEPNDLGMISAKISDIIEILERSIPTNPSKWAAAKAAAKRKFKVYPSAYANLWAAKKYKSMGGGWRSGKNEVHYPHKRRDAMGQEDSDINNDGKVDLLDKMLKAKRDLYKRYLIAKKKGQTSL